jgi:hypothetical protein
MTYDFTFMRYISPLMRTEIKFSRQNLIRALSNKFDRDCFVRFGEETFVQVGRRKFCNFIMISLDIIRFKNVRP